jgi:hypothetical protein
MMVLGMRPGSYSIRRSRAAISEITSASETESELPGLAP